ncbi:M56 family metallopeptidase [Oscillibacter valericigenes]|nr:M56 family metallopeptidase [Oscillibacter valericigenes]
MAAVFLKLLNLSISASWLVLAVLVLRLISKRSPKWVNVLLWGIVALRLVLPFSIESALSLIPSAETVSPAAVQFDPAPTITSGVSIIDNAVNPSLSEHFAAVPTASVNPLYVWTEIAGWVWLIGLGAMLLYALVSYLRLRRRVSVSLPIRDRIYLCDAISSPFILGVVKPHIYLPSGLDEVQRQNVLAHERAHLARRDHWWKPLGFALLAVYWFNPVLWLAYTLLCRDIELACDEKVIRDMDVAAKKAYSIALLSCSTHRNQISACPLAFGEVGVKERVRNALHYKKPAFWVVAASVAVCVVVAVCFLTDPPTDTDAAGLVGFHREQVTYADVTDASGTQPSSVQLTAEETDAIYALLDAMQYKRLGAASAMQDCYARLHFISAAGERCEVMLSEREMLVNPITGGKTARLYELRSGSTELRDYLLECIGASDAAPEQMSHPTLSDDLTEAERSIVDEFLHWAQGLRAEDILNLQFHDGSSSRFLVDAEQTALSAQLVPALNALSEAELYTQQGYGDSTYYTLTVNLRDGTDYIFLCGFDCVRLLHPTFEPSLSSSYPSSRPTLWIDSPALMACINSLHSPPTPLPDPETVAGHSDAVSTTGYAAYDALLAEISGLRRSGASEAQTDFSHDLLSANDYYQTPGWLLRDLDGDEIPELLLGADWGDGHSVIFNIYRLDGAKAVRVVDGWNRNRWYLCTDGSLANEGSSSAFESSYSYYRYTSGELQHLETLLYLDGGSGGSPWRYSATADHYVSSGDFRSVTEAEATAVRDKYTHETLILTPFVV